MYVEAVTVCINFADFLAETLPRNRGQFQRWVVVTSEEDNKTKQVCLNNNAEIVVTERHKENGADFNKGKAINDGLRYCRRRGWLCHVDADIVLPDEFGQRLPRLVTSAAGHCHAVHCIYGIHRLMCESYRLWQQYLWEENLGLFSQECERRSGVHLPVGFFQLWSGLLNRWYPEHIPTATTSDLEFSKQWHPHQRRHLDERCIHLSSVPHERWLNWRGRTSPVWGAST